MAPMPKRAMVLAAGKGLRMRPITDKTPKPMIPVNGRPLIDHALDRLRDAGVEQAVVNTHYLGEQIERHLASRETPAISFSPEIDLLETGGGVKKALPLLGRAPFIVANSDALWLNGPTDALQRMATVWDDEKMDALLLLHSTVEAYGYTGRGDFNCEADGKLSRRLEMEVTPWLFTGIQILKPEVFADTPDGAFSLNHVYDQLLDTERLYGIVHDGEWFHIGTPSGLAEAEAFMKIRYAGNRHR
jgi:N-acetyl-alpha-D-muramate 1-phosphate uridylyltransferase